MTAATLDRYAYRLGPNDQLPQASPSLRRLGISVYIVVEDRGRKALIGRPKKTFSRLLIIYVMHMCYRRKQPANIEKKTPLEKIQIVARPRHKSTFFARSVLQDQILTSECVLQEKSSCQGKRNQKIENTKQAQKQRRKDPRMLFISDVLRDVCFEAECPVYFQFPASAALLSGGFPCPRCCT